MYSVFEFEMYKQNIGIKTQYRAINLPFGDRHCLLHICRMSNKTGIRITQPTIPTKSVFFSVL
jgi:hypothetical protein